MRPRLIEVKQRIEHGAVELRSDSGDPLFGYLLTVWTDSRQAQGRQHIVRLIGCSKAGWRVL